MWCLVGWPSADDDVWMRCGWIHTTSWLLAAVIFYLG